MRFRILPLTLTVLLACAQHVPPQRVSISTLHSGQTDSGLTASPGPAGETRLEAPTAPTDLLYLKRIDFRKGAPTISIRLMEGRDEAIFTSRGHMRMTVEGPVPKFVDAPSGTRWRIRILNGSPARLIVRILLGEAQYTDREKLIAEQQSWRERGLETHLHSIGAVYGVAGKVIDNRRYQLLTDSALDPAASAVLQERLLREFGVRTTTVNELEQQPSGNLEISDSSGNVVAVAQNLASVEGLDGAGFDVRDVEFNVGYDSHGFEDRSFRGGLQFVVDRNGKLAVINLATLEDLAKGIVPSEIFPRAHPEALKAQAVTARAEILAKIGLRHLTDPYLLCSEQHCSVYKGLSGESASTNAAVEATRGEGLFSSNGELVDAVYSAVCGGHTEDNDSVWGTPPNPNLRGRPDVLTASPIPSPRTNTDGFLSSPIPAACRLSTLAQPGKFRWERKFTAGEMDDLAAPLKLGAIRAITVAERGASGRAKVVTLAGENAATQLRGELNIRRFFKMLNSALFVVGAEHDDAGKLVSWFFRGGGWGHGVGMCQTGAIGRAEAGQNYREILRYYYNGAEVHPIY